MKSRLLIVLLLSGCAAQGPAGIGEGPERNYIGVIEKVEATTRGGVSPSVVMPLTVFGAVGGAIAGLAAADRSTRMHTIKLESGSTVSVISDDELQPGDCVRMVVREASTEPLPWYSYGQASLNRVACASSVK